ncbi:MAG TPA: RnfH family protein [Steroidobacteraceae bacterium]|nr:RnfH family protein [Steroidobacteraceae bacterium]
MLRCEVAYARPDRQVVAVVELGEGATAADALRASGLLENCSEIDPATATFGVFGRVVPADHPLQDGDRVEIYRPLKVDPRAARRARARSAR